MKDKLNLVMGWARGNLVSVICLAIAIIALPTMYVFGSRWNTSQRTKVEADVKKQTSDLAAAKVDYTLEPVTPSEKPFTVAMPPNEATTRRMQVLLVKTAEQVGGVRDKVIEFNREEKKPLIDGLFPKPAQPIDEPALAEAMAKGVFPAHAAMLTKYRGGPPPEPSDVEQRLKEIQFREQEATKAGRADGKLNPEDEAALTARLSLERMQLYTSRALDLHFYADQSVFADLVQWKETSPPSLDDCWEWQWVLWFHEDLLRAVDKANDGQSLIRGGVKRIERIRVDPPTKATATLGADPTAAVPRDFSKSFSGRVGPNGLYDVRYADVVVLVASDQIPRLLDAIARTNLMTVVGFDVSSVDDLPAHTRQGYVYSRGGEHIARVRMRVESLWLRDWTGAWMPEHTKSLLGFAGAAPPPAGDATNPNPNPSAGQPAGPQNERAPKGGGGRLK